jgi:AcrR family transcriptional regulator
LWRAILSDPCSSIRVVFMTLPGTPAPPSRAGGRPRDADRTAEILRAALDLVEEVGFRQVTVERVAARTGVAKTTIYRRWPNVSVLVTEAFLAQVTAQVPVDETLSAREALRGSMRALTRVFLGKGGQILSALLGQAQTDEVLRQTLLERWLMPRRQLGLEVVRRGKAGGELQANLDENLVIDALFGPLYYRLMMPYAGLSEAYADEVLRQVFAGLEPDLSEGRTTSPVHS